jgi:hypothetical protein
MITKVKDLPEVGRFIRAMEKQTFPQGETWALDWTTTEGIENYFGKSPRSSIRCCFEGHLGRKPGYAPTRIPRPEQYDVWTRGDEVFVRRAAANEDEAITEIQFVTQDEFEELKEDVERLKNRKQLTLHKKIQRRQ